MSIDYRLEQWINGPAGHIGWLDALMVAFAAGAEVAFGVAVLAWILAAWGSRAILELAAAGSALVAAGIALVVNLIAGRVWNHPRPFQTHPATVHVLLAHAPGGSFPSDHAAAAFAIATVVVARHRRVGIAVLAIAAIVCYARVYVGDHYPLDVVAGAAIGVVAGLFVLGALQRLAHTIAAWLVAQIPQRS